MMFLWFFGIDRVCLMLPMRLDAIVWVRCWLIRAIGSVSNVLEAFALGRLIALLCIPQDDVVGWWPRSTEIEPIVGAVGNAEHVFV